MWKELEEKVTKRMDAGMPLKVKWCLCKKSGKGDLINFDPLSPETTVWLPGISDDLIVFHIHDDRYDDGFFLCGFKRSIVSVNSDVNGMRIVDPRIGEIVILPEGEDGR